jgi:hypothetical protein
VIVGSYDELMSPHDGYLAELRRAAGLTQEELAERCGLSVRAISAVAVPPAATIHLCSAVVD